MYNNYRVLIRIEMSAPKFRFIGLTGVCLLIFLGSLSACGQKAKTETVTVPIDTTVVDDDTLEVNDTTSSKQTEHAR
jgi:hypothetical protein